MRKPSSHCVAILLFILLEFLPLSSWALDGLEVGMRAPAFTLSTLNGQTINLNDFQDAKAILVVFWASWSAYAPELLDRVERLHKKYKGGALVILGVNVENQRMGAKEIAAASQTVQQHGLTFSTLLDRGLKTFRDYGVMAVPSTVLLDSKYILRAVLPAYPLAGREEFFEAVEALATGKKLKARRVNRGPRPAPKAVRYYNLGRALIGRGMTDEAESHLNKAMEVDPKFVFPPLLLARLYRERAGTEESIEFRGKRYVTATYRAERKALLTKAERLLGICVSLAPKQPLVLLEFGQTKVAQGDVAEGRLHLTKAMKADPTLPLTWALMGALDLRAGNRKKAERAFAEARRLNPMDFRIELTLAEAYAAKGVFPKAIASYKRAYKLLRTTEATLFQYSYGR